MGRGPFELNGTIYDFNGNFSSTGKNHGLVAELVERDGQRTLRCTVQELREMQSVPKMHVQRARASCASKHMCTRREAMPSGVRLVATDTLPLNTGNHGGSRNRPGDHGTTSGNNKSSSSSSSSSNRGVTAKTSTASTAKSTSNTSTNASRSSNGSGDRDDDEDDRPGGGGGPGKGFGPHGPGAKKKATNNKRSRVDDDNEDGNLDDLSPKKCPRTKHDPTVPPGSSKARKVATPPRPDILQSLHLLSPREKWQLTLATAQSPTQRGGDGEVASSNEVDEASSEVSDSGDELVKQVLQDSIRESSRTLGLKEASTSGQKAGTHSGGNKRSTISTPAASDSGDADSVRSLTQPVVPQRRAADESAPNAAATSMSDFEEQKTKAIEDLKARVEEIHRAVLEYVNCGDKAAANAASAAGKAESKWLRELPKMSLADFRLYQLHTANGSKLVVLEAEKARLRSQLQLKENELKEETDYSLSFNEEYLAQVFELKDAIGKLETKIRDAKAESAEDLHASALPDPEPITSNRYQQLLEGLEKNAAAVSENIVCQEKCVRHLQNVRGLCGAEFKKLKQLIASYEQDIESVQSNIDQLNEAKQCLRETKQRITDEGLAFDVAFSQAEHATAQYQSGQFGIYVLSYTNVLLTSISISLAFLFSKLLRASQKA